MSFDERVELASGYWISRVIRGGWQLAGGHGEIDKAAVDDDLLAFYQAGITTFDCADIYTGVEEMIGTFRSRTMDRLGSDSLTRLKVHTKFVPDLAVLPTISRSYVRSIIERSLHRLRQERLDLVQFHWWDYAVPGWIETAGWLGELQAEGKIDLLGGTNFDTPRLEALIASGATIKTMQVQYSLLDNRPEASMVATCNGLGVQLLCYGSIAGGFLSERWLGAPEPVETFENRSLIKYKLIIDDFGGWRLFQALLETLRDVARRHDTTIATVSARYILDRPAVAAVIMGARGPSHLRDTVGIGALRLNDTDRRLIEDILAQRRGPQGEVYAVERDRSGPHGAIMKYNLND